MENTIKRVQYIDITKAIGIILVVIGHSGAPITNYIYLFHMALFFFVSGYFWKDIYLEYPFKFICNKFKTLSLVFLKYQLIFLLLHNIFFKINIYSDKVGFGEKNDYMYNMVDFLKNIISILTLGGRERMGGALWFLNCLFWVNLIFFSIRFFINKVLKKESGYITLILVFICVIIGDLFKIPRYIDAALVSVSIYFMGYLYKKYEHKIPIRIMWTIISIVLLQILSKKGDISIADKHYPNLLFFFISSLLGIYVIISISKFICKTKLNLKLLKYIGNNTITVMALHFLSFKIIAFIQVITYSLPLYMIGSFPIIYKGGNWWILYSIIGVFIPISIKFIYDRARGLLHSQ